MSTEAAAISMGEGSVCSFTLNRMQVVAMVLLGSALTIEQT